MRGARWGLVMLAVALSAAPPALGAPAETEAALDAINDARSRAGLRPLALSSALTRSSETFAGHIMRTGVFAHAGTIQAAGRLQPARRVHRHAHRRRLAAAAGRCAAGSPRRATGRCS